MRTKPIASTVPPFRTARGGSALIVAVRCGQPGWPDPSLADSVEPPRPLVGPAARGKRPLRVVCVREGERHEGRTEEARLGRSRRHHHWSGARADPRFVRALGISRSLNQVTSATGRDVI